MAVAVSIHQRPSQVSLATMSRQMMIGVFSQNHTVEKRTEVEVKVPCFNIATHIYSSCIWCVLILSAPPKTRERQISRDKPVLDASTQ